MDYRYEEAAKLLRGHVFYTYQEPVILRDTVLDNLSLCPSPDWEVVEVLGLRPLVGARARDLSGGYKRLLTAACRPRVALLNEPTAFLDREKRGSVPPNRHADEGRRHSSLNYSLSPRDRKSGTRP